MKKILFFCAITIASCKVLNTPSIENKAEGVVIVCYERPVKNSDNLYYLKSRKCIVNNRELDLVDWVEPNSELERILKRYGVDSDVSLSKCCFSSAYERGAGHLSECTYNWLNDEDEIYVIFNFKGKVLLMNKLPDDRKYGIYNHYSCPIVLDTLTSPFYKILEIDSCFSPSKGWLNDNNYYKTKIDSFNINFCD